jgi:hypothetical protein
VTGWRIQLISGVSVDRAELKSVTPNQLQIAITGGDTLMVIRLGDILSMRLDPVDTVAQRARVGQDRQSMRLMKDTTAARSGSRLFQFVPWDLSYKYKVISDLLNGKVPGPP